MPKSKAEMMRTLRARRKAAGLVEFRVMVDAPRAKFLARMMEVDLCEHCSRERDECEPDPCEYYVRQERRILNS